MATRASIKFKDSDGNFIANVYHHYDGYPESLGVKLLELTKGKIVNGLGFNITAPQVFNGFGCLTASVIEGLKEGPGGVYLYPEDEYGNVCEDYLYVVVELENGCNVFVMNRRRPVDMSTASTGAEFVPVEDILEKINNK